MSVRAPTHPRHHRGRSKETHDGAHIEAYTQPPVPFELLHVYQEPQVRTEVGNGDWLTGYV